MGESARTARRFPVGCAWDNFGHFTFNLRSNVHQPLHRGTTTTAAAPGSPPMFSNYKLHVVQSKLEDEVANLNGALERNGGDIVPSADSANVIITGIHARKRLQRHLDVDEAISVRCGLDLLFLNVKLTFNRLEGTLSLLSGCTTPHPRIPFSPSQTTML